METFREAEMTISNSGVLKDTADIRAKLLEIWRLVDEKKISSSEARLHISVARAILDTLKVEMAAAHLAQSAIPSVSIGRPLRMRDQ
jgi:predicted DNA-binding protein (UPF0251 family)